MTEINSVKFYFARYFFLALGLLQGLTATLLLVQFGLSPKNIFAVFVFFTLSMILLSIHWMVVGRFKRVILDKKKISVVLPSKTKQYDWEDVKELKHLAFLNIYSLKLKGKRKQIYFLPTSREGALFGLFGSNLSVVGKK
jgi:hypothetical protein